MPMFEICSLESIHKLKVKMTNPNWTWMVKYSRELLFSVERSNVAEMCESLQMMSKVKERERKFVFDFLEEEYLTIVHERIQEVVEEEEHHPLSFLIGNEHFSSPCSFSSMNAIDWNSTMYHE